MLNPGHDVFFMSLTRKLVCLRHGKQSVFPSSLFSLTTESFLDVLLLWQYHTKLLQYCICDIADRFRGGSLLCHIYGPLFTP